MAIVLLGHLSGSSLELAEVAQAGRSVRVVRALAVAGPAQRGQHVARRGCQQVRSRTRLFGEQAVDAQARHGHFNRSVAGNNAWIGEMGTTGAPSGTEVPDILRAWCGRATRVRLKHAGGEVADHP